MAKTESTAVNALIDLAGRKPLDMEGSDDLMFARPALRATDIAPPSVPRAATGTRDLTPTRAAGASPLAGIAPPRSATMPPPLPRTTGQIPAVNVAPPPPPLPTSSPSIPLPRTTGQIPAMSAASVTPPAPRRTAASSSQQPALPRPRTTLPPPRPTARAAEGTPQPELLASPPVSAPIATPAPVRAVPSAPIVAAAPPKKPAGSQAGIDLTNTDGWFESTREIQQVDRVEQSQPIDVAVDESWSGTMAVQRQPIPWTKFALPAGILALFAIILGGYFAFNGEGGGVKHPGTVAAKPIAGKVLAVAPSSDSPATAPVAAATPVAPAEPAAVATPTAAAAPAAAAAPVAVAAPAADPAPAIATTPTPALAPTTGALETVRFESQPAGATVTLMDGGKPTFLGNSPVDAQIDTSRAYDVVFALDGHPTQMKHLAPGASPHLLASLDGAPTPAPAAPAHAAPAHVATAQAASAPSRPHHHADSSSSFSDAIAPTPHASVAASSGGGKGVLMVSAKPPCDIVVDGRPTGLKTPQRSLSLSAGSHRITLVNADQNLTRSVSVSIKAGQSTKLIQNLMN